jgi:hypothetical protein
LALLLRSVHRETTQGFLSSEFLTLSRDPAISGLVNATDVFLLTARSFESFRIDRTTWNEATADLRLIIVQSATQPLFSRSTPHPDAVNARDSALYIQTDSLVISSIIDSTFPFAASRLFHGTVFGLSISLSALNPWRSHLSHESNAMSRSNNLGQTQLLDLSDVIFVSAAGFASSLIYSGSFCFSESEDNNRAEREFVHSGYLQKRFIRYFNGFQCLIRTNEFEQSASPSQSHHLNMCVFDSPPEQSDDETGTTNGSGSWIWAEIASVVFVIHVCTVIGFVFLRRSKGQRPKAADDSAGGSHRDGSGI